MTERDVLVPLLVGTSTALGYLFGFCRAWGAGWKEGWDDRGRVEAHLRQRAQTLRRAYSDLN